MATVTDTIQQIDKLEGQRQYGAALDLASKSMRSFQGAPPIAMRLAALFETTKQFEKALNLYKRITDDKREADGTTPLPLALGLGVALFGLTLAVNAAAYAVSRLGARRAGAI